MCKRVVSPTEKIGCKLDGPSGETFELTKWLGQGAFGTVYAAKGLSSGLVVAVKMLNAGELDDPASKAALLNEIDLAAQVEHENVVRVLHVEKECSGLGPYVVLEHVDGGTLASILQSARDSKEPIPFERAQQLMLDIVNGAAAINKRLVHRDIKPDNILWDGSRLKITGFGLSKLVDARTRTHTFKGQQAIMYMAPEGWRGETNTPKIDIYSVGLVCYEIFALRHPLEDSIADKDDWRAWEKAHLFTPCPDVRQFRAETSLAISQLLHRMVEKRPQDRPDWDQVLRILASEHVDAGDSLVSGAVRAAIERKREVDKKVLEQQEIQEKKIMGFELYRYSCTRLIEQFTSVVKEFNAQFQFGSIEVEEDAAGWAFKLPNATYIRVQFFSPRDTQIHLLGGRLIGGGFLGNRDGPSCNLLLIRESDDDLYGRWAGCFLKFMALVEPDKVARSLHMHLPRIEPFGLESEALFYDHIQHAQGAMHVFTYEMVPDLKKLFADFLETTFQTPR